MAAKKDVEQSSEQTLITLDQLSQTLEVMTCVVDRLKSHLTRQMSLNAEMFEDQAKVAKAEAEERAESSKLLQQEGFVVEISQKELEEGSDPNKIIH